MHEDLKLLNFRSMSTLTIDLALSDPASGSTCAKCTGPTRLIGIEPHPTKAHTDLRTYRCLVCDHLQAAIVPLTS